MVVVVMVMRRRLLCMRHATPHDSSCIGGKEALLHASMPQEAVNGCAPVQPLLLGFEGCGPPPRIATTIEFSQLRSA
eukprot:11179650-Lingulodinium_polyedra.AAC.1